MSVIGAMRSLRDRLLAPVDVAPLAYFRVVFGITMMVEVYRFFSKEWIDRYYIEPLLFFSYPGFDWVKPWPGQWMYVHFAAMGLLAALLTLGLLYRVAAPLFWLAITYVFLLDPTHYLNHMYLVCLLAFLLSGLPLGGAFALDARLGLARARESVPTWMLWLIRTQVGLVYFFGGIAKLDADWLSGIPGAMFLRQWEPTAALADNAWAAQLFALSGLLFDLQGHNFSWHMKLRNKSGVARFQARDPRTGERWEVDLEPLLTERQYSKMTTRPEHVRQLAHLIARHYERQGRPGLEVYADVWVSLNGRPRQPMVDPQVDLTRQGWSWGAAAWILPLRDDDGYGSRLHGGVSTPAYRP